MSPVLRLPLPGCGMTSCACKFSPFTSRWMARDAPTPANCCWRGPRFGLEVADGDEVADGGVADVGAALDHLFGGRPILVADLPGAEDMTAAPATLDPVGALR